ncbi:unnamed protein product [Tenebrio molitor]|nr:unnamed protein product [Tenebrio molitor]
MIDFCSFGGGAGECFDWKKQRFCLCGIYSECGLGVRIFRGRTAVRTLHHDQCGPHPRADRWGRPLSHHLFLHHSLAVCCRSQLNITCTKELKHVNPELLRASDISPIKYLHVHAIRIASVHFMGAGG